MPMLTNAQAYNALTQLFHADYRKLEAALKQYGDWQKAARALTAHDEIKRWDRLTTLSIRLLLQNDPDFPALLSEIPWQPFGIYVRGQLLKKKPAIAIVGTRKATRAGLETAHRFALEFAKSGVTVISGLALGIDAASHTGALAAHGETIAVLGNGLDTIYPKQHERLAQEILTQHGALVSEYPIETPSLPRFFIERNRLISGLSLGIVVIEAPERSGALSTARFAIEQNRDVFVVPGAIGNPNYAGSHNLLKSGATLVTDPAEVLAGLNITISTSLSSAAPMFDKLTENQKTIVRALLAAGKALDLDALCQKAHLPIHLTAQTISLLVIEGIIKEDGGTYYL